MSNENKKSTKVYITDNQWDEGLFYKNKDEIPQAIQGRGNDWYNVRIITEGRYVQQMIPNTNCSIDPKGYIIGDNQKYYFAWSNGHYSEVSEDKMGLLKQYL